MAITMKGNKEENGGTFASCPSSEVREPSPGRALKSCNCYEGMPAQSGCAKAIVVQSSSETRATVSVQVLARNRWHPQPRWVGNGIGFQVWEVQRIVPFAGARAGPFSQLPGTMWKGRAGGAVTSAAWHPPSFTRHGPEPTRHQSFWEFWCS